MEKLAWKRKSVSAFVRRNAEAFRHKACLLRPVYMGLIFVHPVSGNASGYVGILSGVPMEDVEGVPIVLFRHFVPVIYQLYLIGVDNGLADESTQSVIRDFPFYPFFPSIAGVIFPYRAGDHIVCPVHCNNVCQYVRDRGDLVDGLGGFTPEPEQVA